MPAQNYLTRHLTQSRHTRRPVPWKLFEAAIAGVLLALAFIPYPWSFLAPLPLAWIFGLVAKVRTLRGAFGIGLAAGLGFFGLHLLWLPISFSGLFGPSVVPLLLLLPLILGVFWGITAALCHLAGRYTLLALPFAWVVMEYLRSLGVFGFTWGTLGYAFLPTPIIQVADLGGVYLVSLLVAGTAAALASGAKRHLWPAVVMAGLLTAAVGYGLTRPAPPIADRHVLLVQGAINPLDKAASRSLDELELYQRLTQRGLAENGAELVIWPEGASPLPVDDLRLQNVMAGLEKPIIVGAPSYQNGYQNSAYGFAGGFTSSYSKIKLVPFGERFPLRRVLAFVYDPLFSAIGLPGFVGTKPGDAFVPLELGDITAGTYICYESVFPQAARSMVRAGANLLVNISNDAWFGRTAGAEQHFQMGRVRAIETRRYVARAGNDGITAVIDPLGRVLERFPRGERGAFKALVGLSEVQTPYVRWGDWAVGTSATVLALLAALALQDQQHLRKRRG